VIFEIQQNSDTTYRVFDWNRPGLDGKPRPLHVRESLDCIDFADHQPKLVQTPFSPEPGLRRQGLARHTFFQVDRVQAPPGPLPLRRAGTMQALGVIEGAVHVQTASCALEVLPGRFVLLPAIMEAVSLSAPLATRLLLVEPAQG
jgi:mannose-6-phosphate isomerase